MDGDFGSGGQSTGTWLGRRRAPVLGGLAVLSRWFPASVGSGGVLTCSGGAAAAELLLHLQRQPRSSKTRRHILHPHLDLLSLPSATSSSSPHQTTAFSSFSSSASRFPFPPSSSTINSSSQANMSLSSKLSITDVDVADKRVLIRVSLTRRWLPLCRCPAI